MLHSCSVKTSHKKNLKLTFSTSAEMSFFMLLFWVHLCFMMRSFFQKLRICLLCDFSSMQVAKLLNNSSVYGQQWWVWDKGQGGVSVWVECVFVCWQWENNSSWVHKTEEGFSSAGTVLTPLSQSGLVAMSAVNLPLCVAEWERDTLTCVSQSPRFWRNISHVGGNWTGKLFKLKYRNTLSGSKQ